MKRALVISGGGSKGAYAIGVLKRLLEAYPGLNFDLYVGTSTGALIAPLAAIDEIDLLASLYTSLHTEDVVLANRLGDVLNEVGIFDVEPLRQLLLTHYGDQRYQQLSTAGKEVFLTTTCLQSGELVVFTNATDPAKSALYQTRKIESARHFRRAVLASASQPVFMPPVKVNEIITGEPFPNFQFVDGGVREYAGVQIAIDNGATEVFTILLSSGVPAIENKEYQNLFDILKTTIDIFTDDVGKNDLIIPQQYNAALQYIDAVKKRMLHMGISQPDMEDCFIIPGMENPFQNKKPLKLYQFRPSAPLGGGAGGLEFDPQVMKGMLQKGIGTANDFIAKMSQQPADLSWT